MILSTAKKINYIMGLILKAGNAYLDFDDTNRHKLEMLIEKHFENKWKCNKKGYQTVAVMVY